MTQEEKEMLDGAKATIETVKARQAVRTKMQKAIDAQVAVAEDFLKLAEKAQSADEFAYWFQACGGMMGIVDTMEKGVDKKV